MDVLLDFLLKLISQFAGGTGQMENNLVRFSIPSVTYGVLFSVAWYRQREYHMPREKLLMWGFGLGCASSVVMAFFVALQMMEILERKTVYPILVPVERALEIASIIVVAGAFLRYILDDHRLAKRFIIAGSAVTLISLGLALWKWPYYYAMVTEAHFHATWVSKQFEVVSSVFIITAIILLRRKSGWLSNVMIVAMVFFLLGEVLLLVNYWTDKAYALTICPIGNSFPMLAIFLLGYVYLREQAIETRRAQKDLETYRDHLEDQVQKRMLEVFAANEKLKDEVTVRKKAEEAFEQLSRQYQLILDSAGEGICGIDHLGRFVFVNTAAARLLGYQAEELVGRSSHAIWMQDGKNGSLPSREHCPICNGYILGIPSRGDDQFFWRKDHTCFPVYYVSTPTYENKTLTGSVVVFRDITERKKAEAEIAQRNANLAAQNIIAATLSRSLDLETILNTVLDAVLSVTEMEAGLVFLWDEDQENLVLRSHRGPIFQTHLKRPVEEWNCCKMISADAMGNFEAVVRAVSDCPAAHRSPLIRDEAIQTLVSVPLVSNDRALGALTLASRKAGPIDPQEIELLTAIGQQIGMAIENAHLYAEAEREAEELTLLHELSTVLTSTLSTVKIYEEIVKQSVKLLNCQAGCILVWNEEQQKVDLVSSCGLTRDEIAFVEPHIPNSPFLVEFIKRHQVVTIGDAQSDPRISVEGKQKLQVRAVLSVPLIGTEESPGSLILIDRQSPRRWSHKELMLIESFVNRAAVALMNANLIKQLEWAAALEERQRIAADMHDGLAQTVSLLKLQVEGAMDLVSSGSARKAYDELSITHETIKQVSIEVRRSIASLQSTPQPRRPLQERLKALPDQITRSLGHPIDFVFQIDEPLFLPREQEDQVLLVIQEALLNAHRHAQAKQIRLTLERQDQAIRIIVEDDGVGFEPGVWWDTGQHHFGMRIMHSRAARIGAELQVTSCPAQGTRVVLSLPHTEHTIRGWAGQATGEFHQPTVEQGELP